MKKFTELCSLSPNWQRGAMARIALMMRQAIIWTIDGLVYWRIYTSTGFKMFVIYYHLHGLCWPQRFLILALRTLYCSDVIMSALASQIISVSSVCSTVCSGADQINHQSSASLASARNPPVTGGFPSQNSSNTENAFIWWRHHEWNHYIRDYILIGHI